MSQFTLGGYAFYKDLSGEVGINSGRHRYLVTCQTCIDNKKAFYYIVHESTTGPMAQARMHLVEHHGVSRDESWDMVTNNEEYKNG